MWSHMSENRSVKPFSMVFTQLTNPYLTKS